MCCYHCPYFFTCYYKHQNLALNPFYNSQSEMRLTVENRLNNLINFENEKAIKSVIWKQKYIFKNNKSIKIDLNNDKKDEIFELGMEVQSGTRIRVIMGNKAYNLLEISSLKNNRNLFDDNGDVLEGYYAQASFYDFDGDKKPEIIVAIGDKLVNLGVSIFKYTGDKNTPFKEIGYIEGQEYIHINKYNQIMIPYGSQGLFDAYKYDKGKIVEMNPSEYKF